MQIRLIQTKVYYKHCYIVSNEASHKPLKVAAAKKSFPSMFIIDTTSLNVCYPQAWCNRHVAAFFETSVLKEVRILCPSVISTAILQ